MDKSKLLVKRYHHQFWIQRVRARTLFLVLLSAGLPACEGKLEPDDFYVETVEVSEDPSVQSAYEGCVVKMIHELIENNQTIHRDILRKITKSAPDLCYTFVVQPCAAERDGSVCVETIREYAGQEFQ